MKLQMAVSFEELAARKAINHLTIKKTTIEGNKQSGYLIETVRTSAVKAERWREMTVCLIPCNKYRHPYNDPKNCFFGHIKNIQRDALKICIKSKKPLDQKLDYHVDFIPNRVVFKACINAMKNLNDLALRNFFTTFQSSGHLSAVGKVFVMRQQFFENCEFEWFNHSIAANEEQKLAIKNIVNCISFPLPQIVFGPPGKSKKHSAACQFFIHDKNR